MYELHSIHLLELTLHVLIQKAMATYCHCQYNLLYIPSTEHGKCVDFLPIKHSCQVLLKAKCKS